MAHVRKQIRDYFLTQLTGLDTTGSNAFASRIYTLDNAKLPALIVYTNSESSNDTSFGFKKVQERRLEVVVEAYVRALTTFDDDIDQICEEVEEAILDAPQLGGLAILTELQSTEANYSGEAEQPIATVRLSFEVTYRTEVGTPTVTV